MYLVLIDKIFQLNKHFVSGHCISIHILRNSPFISEPRIVLVKLPDN